MPVITGVPGDATAEGRLLVSGTAQDMRYIEWGLESLYYNPATSLLVDSDDMVTTGYAGVQTTQTGAYDPNATGNNVIRATLLSTPLVLCSTGNLAHVGVFRVKARVGATTVSGDTSPVGEYIRLSWQDRGWSLPGQLVDVAAFRRAFGCRGVLQRG
jgi:hypothetical protein